MNLAKKGVWLLLGLGIFFVQFNSLTKNAEAKCGPYDENEVCLKPTQCEAKKGKYVVLDVGECTEKGTTCCTLPPPPPPPPCPGLCTDSKECPEGYVTDSSGVAACLQQAMSMCCKQKGLAPPTPEVTPPGNPDSGMYVPEKKAVNVPGGILEGINPACINEGRCSLNDILDTGINVAKFLMGLSGALFFVIFLYGGAMYLLSFGDTGRIKKGTEAIKGAAIGIVIVAGAWTIVRYIAVTIADPGYFAGKQSGPTQPKAQPPAPTKKP